MTVGEIVNDKKEGKDEEENIHQDVTMCGREGVKEEEEWERNDEMRMGKRGKR